MKKLGWFSRRPREQRCCARMAQVAAGVGMLTALMLTTGMVVAQNAAPGAEIPTPAQMTVPDGYTAHHSVDLGGRMSNQTGSQAMYDTLVNLQSGPRVLGETFEMRALPGKKNAPVDYLKAFGSGFGGDPYNFARLDASKGKYFDYTGLFRRDRQYFDYDLLGNPNIVAKTVPIGPSNAPTDSIPWGPVNQSPLLFNTVRRMLDNSLTVMPLAKVTYRFGYSRNVFEGPTLSPSYSVFKYDGLLQEYLRNSTDDYLAAIDWKPVQRTTVTLQEEINHYKADSYFTLNPNGFQVQEADGTKAYLGNWDSQVPYGIAACNTNSMGSGYTNSTTYTILSPSQTPGGLPVINAACSVVTSYMRTQPTRITIPTSFLHFQSSSIRNVSMDGDVRYTLGTMRLPNYYENAQGLNGLIRSTTWSGYAQAHRSVLSADYGLVWQATNNFALEDQVDFFNSAEPGYSDVPKPVTLSDPTGAGNGTINYNGPLVGGTGTLPHGIEGILNSNYFGMEFLTNTLTGRWDVSPKTSLSLGYRYGNRKIGQGVPHAGAIPLALADPVNGTVEINQNGGIFTIAYRPTTNWNVNGSVEGMFFDNVFTPVAPRQAWHYRLHTTYRPKPWATVTGAYNDIERKNNTNNNQAVVAAGIEPYEGPIDHVDHSRLLGVGTVLAPNDQFSLDLNYSYGDVYTATNVCFTSGASATLPGTATLTSTGGPNICPGVYALGSTTTLVAWHARDFMDAPTNAGTAALSYKPEDDVKMQFGYAINSVKGSRFYNDARSVNGSLVSDYQTPFINVAWTTHPGLTWKAEYNYYGYTEGGPSGPQYCSTSTTFTTTVVPCTSLPQPTGLTEPTSGLTAPRNFRANNVVVGVHYEF